jgi:AbrB family looped-hinge helix DNA binding protein
MSKITSKGQVTLPVKVRKHLEVNAGDTVIFDFVGDMLVIRKARNIENYFNTLPPLDGFYKEKLGEAIASDAWKKQ